MKSPEMSNQERQNDNPISRVESNPRVDQLKKDLKFSFWDFQAKNGTNASVVDFANDSSFAQRLNEAKQSGLSMEEMGIAVDFIRDTYGKKVIAKQDSVTVSSLDRKYDVSKGAETENDDHREGEKRNGDGNNNSEQNEDDIFLKDIRSNLDRITAEANARDQEERQRIENETTTNEKLQKEEQRKQADTRERDILQREADILRDVEKKKQVESFVKNVEKEFSSLKGKFFVKMREDQYDKAGLPLNIDRYTNYMNNVYSEVRNYMPFEDDLLFSIRDNTLVCTAGRSIEKVDLASFDIKDLDDSSREQVLQDIKNKWKTFASDRINR